MNKLIIISIATVALMSGCGKKDDVAAKTDATAAAASEPVKADVQPQVVAPKPPPPPSGGKSAPELTPEDIARIQALLKKQAEQQAAPAAK